jgi:hypothetical protein
VARQGLDELRILRRISQGLAQFLDGMVQAVVELDEGVGGPEPGSQVFSRDNFARTLDQCAEYFEGLRRKRDLLTVIVEFAGR